MKRLQVASEGVDEIKKKEEALRKSEERYRHLFESISDAVMIFDAETLRFEDANEAALGLFGYSKEECLTLTPVDISAEPQKTRARLKKTRKGRTEKRHLPLRYFKRKDGMVFPGVVSAKPAPHSDVGASRNLLKDWIPRGSREMTE